MTEPKKPLQNIEKIRVGNSTCLIDEKVRFDGGHKKNDYIMHTLSDFLMGIGLSLSRYRIRNAAITLR
jgi:hypothetical protein